MDLETLKETEEFALYSQAESYARMIGMYEDTDKNFRFYNGNQWDGVKLKGIEPVQLNFIRPIVRFKVGTMNQNLWAINYSAENYENKNFMQTAMKVCELLNKKSAKMWENDNRDYKIRAITKIAAINDEAPVYIEYDKEKNQTVFTLLSKNDIYFGNENDSDIQSQPYILVKQRMPLINARNLAEEYGVSKTDIENILPDGETFEESGESAKYEKDDMVTIITKLYKKDGNVYFSKAARSVVIKKETNTGLHLYPIAHFIWEEKEGSARGEGEVRGLIPNQIEVNKILTRRLIVTKNTAYPIKAVNTKYISNPNAIDTIGGTLRTDSEAAIDINKIFAISQPAQMSPDVEKLQRDLIDTSRALAGASESALGDIRPDEASGKAILAVQQAQQLPLVEQVSTLKKFIEEAARIELDMLIVYNQKGMKLEEETEDPMTGEKSYQLVDIPGSILQELKASVKVDITPVSAYDRYAQELSLENLLKAGWFAPERIGQIKSYVETLPDNSTMPKQRILEMIKRQEQEQEKIAQIQAQAQDMIQRAGAFLNSDMDTQAEQINEASMQSQIPQMVANS